MTSIDPVRLATIISSLSLQTKNVCPPQNKKGERKSLDYDSAGTADYGALKSRLQQALTKVKKQGRKNYEEAAPKILVQEIILWEFGEDFINHPEYKQISEFVSQSITTHERLSKPLLNFLEDVVKSE